MVEVFGEKTALIGTAGGKIFGAPLARRDEMASAWRRWPTEDAQFASDVVGIMVHPSGDARLEVLVLLRTHEVMRLVVEKNDEPTMSLSSVEIAGRRLRALLVAACEEDPWQVRRRARSFRFEVLRATRQLEAHAGLKPRVDPPQSRAWIPMVRLLRALVAYGEDSGTYFEKERGLRSLIALNRPTRPLDALVYVARLAARRYDVIDEIELQRSIRHVVALRSGTIVCAARHRDRDHGESNYFASSIDDNGVLQVREAFKCEYAPEARALVQAGDALHTWAENGVDKPFEALGWTLHAHPTSQSVEAALGRQRTPGRVDAALQLPGPEVNWVFGVRTDKGPMLVVGAQAIGLAEPSATSASGVGARRICVLLLVDESRVIAATDDGAIYLVALAELQHVVQPAAVVRSRVRQGAMIAARSAGAPCVCIGTADGELLFWSVEGSTLRLRARDHLYADIKAIVTLRIAEEVILVTATSRGMLAVHALPARGADVEERRRYPLLDVEAGRIPFLLMRMLHVRVVPGMIEAIAPLPDEASVRVAIAYQAEHMGSYHLRIVELTPRIAECTADPVDRAKARVGRWLRDAHVGELKFPTILRALPFPGSAVRAFAVRLEIEAMEGEEKGLDGRLWPLLNRALPRDPDDRAEFKALLDAVRVRMRGDRRDWGGVAWCRAIASALPGLIEGDDRCVAAAVRKLLCPTALLPGAFPEGESLEVNLTRILEHSNPLVCLEGLQAMADTLHIIRKEGRERDFFPGSPAERLCAAAPFLRPLARFVAAHPPPSKTATGASAHLWTALVVIRHLMVILRHESVWVLCDQLSVSGASWEAMSVLSQVLPPSDPHLRERFRSYLPWDPRPEVSPAQAADFLDKIDAAPLLDGSPDADFDRARQDRYRWFRTGFDVGTRAAMIEHLRSGAAEVPSDPLEWLQVLDDSRDRFFTVTLRWQRAIYGRFDTLLRESLSGSVEDPMFVAELVRSPKLLDGLLEPERSIAAAMFAAWRGALTRSALLVDDVVGGCVIRKPIPQRSSWVVEGATLRGEMRVMIRINAVPGEVREPSRQLILRRWMKIRQISDALPTDVGQLPRIRDTVPREWGVAMIMDYAGSQIVINGATDEEERKRLARLIARDVAEALTKLHTSQLYHGDVALHNMVVDERGVTLVDFGHAGGPYEQNAKTELGGLPYENASPKWWSNRRPPKGASTRGFQGDVLSLARTLHDLAAGEESVDLQMAAAIVEADDAKAFDLSRTQSGAGRTPFVELVRQTLLSTVVGRARVFVAYSRRDPWSREFVKRAKILGKVPGVDLFIDEGTEPGDNLRKTITAQLRGADIVVVCLSRCFLDTDFVRQEELPEIERRLLDDDSGTRLLIVPVDEAPGLQVYREIAERKAVWPLDRFANHEPIGDYAALIDTVLDKILGIAAQMVEHRRGNGCCRKLQPGSWLPG
ncbi:MAG TPA: hypothetical protein PKW35_06360, partial [Nannocystaceae bacterium]|nr:hypothetical protein [Nannocystaceae bacterium]